MLLGRLHIDSLWIVNGSIGIADPDDLDATLECERESCDRPDIAEALHDGRAFVRVHLQHVHGALDQINDSAASSFAATFSPAD